MEDLALAFLQLQLLILFDSQLAQGLAVEIPDAGQPRHLDATATKVTSGGLQNGVFQLKFSK